MPSIIAMATRERLTIRDAISARDFAQLDARRSISSPHFSFTEVLKSSMSAALIPAGSFEKALRPFFICCFVPWKTKATSSCASSAGVNSKWMRCPLYRLNCNSTNLVFSLISRTVSLCSGPSTRRCESTHATTCPRPLTEQATNPSLTSNVGVRNVRPLRGKLDNLLRLSGTS